GPDTADAAAPIDQSLFLTIVKDLTNADDAVVDTAGETIEYTITVANTGNANLTNVVLDDVFAGGATLISGDDGDNVLEAGETWVYSADYVVTQADLDAGGTLTNVAGITTDETARQTDDATSTVAQSKILHLEKDATVADGTADSTSDVINYTLAVTNTGNAAIAGVVVDDPFTTNEAPVLAGAFNVGDTDQDNLLDVGETWTYTASHQVTQAELDSNGGGDGVLENTATVTGDGATPDSDDASVPVVQSPSLTIVKDLTNPDDAVVDTAGETIEYTITVANTGNIDLTNVVLVDVFAGGATLVSGDLNNNSILETTETWVYTADYVVTQADLNAGATLVNVATVDTDQTSPRQDNATSTVAQSKILHIEKDATVADGTANSTSDTIAYTYTVTNQGNAAIAGVVVTDDNRTPGNTSDDFNPSFTGGDIDGDGLLDVGETWTYTASHQVTQAELDAGTPIVNVATATGDGAAQDTDDASVAVVQS